MYITVNGVNLYYETVGHGRPLVMVHGNGEDRSIFYEAARILKDRFCCYLIDSRDHGLSTKVSTLNYVDMAEDIAQLIIKLGLESPVFYGFSDGGIIGLLIASRYPDLLGRMIISGANLDPDGVKSRIKYRLKLMLLFRNDPKIRMMMEQPHITEKDLRKIRIPVLVLAGSRDLIRESHTRRIARGIENARLRILMGEDHGSYIVHKTRIAHLIIGFCE
jgi:pimeloyl-ACP methyl ester carboxylesterase